MKKYVNKAIEAGKSDQPIIQHIMKVINKKVFIVFW